MMGWGQKNHASDGARGGLMTAATSGVGGLVLFVVADGEKADKDAGEK